MTRSDLWFDDGNVVLQAEDIQFRVHWGVLALHSSFFHDLKALPQPADQPSVDDCPIVELSDAPDEVEYVLRALYVPSFLCQKRLSVPIISALLRLGRKYEFKDLFDSAVARLTSEFPTTVEEYDASGKFKTIEWYDGVHFDIIALATENNILSVLPSACYRAVERYELSILFDGIPRKDGTLASLPQTDLRRCAIGQHRMVLKQFEQGFTLGWVRKWDSHGCTASALCRKGRENMLKGAQKIQRLVLLAGNTEFRVHWDVLALQSSVFRDMLANPPPSKHPDVDGCPVVELSDDPEEVDYLLKVLYTPASFLAQYRANSNDMGQYARARAIPLPIICALIRLGRKYDFKDFHSWAVAQLEAQYPITLEGFDCGHQLDSSIERCTSS
ncbi:BTB domain-containing protein [Mycena sanguinolenta]|uniref:BTB domain-containing protein n=1 Tax=Mycena sanguinolenta TaxID=230812 RepID=A0A8H7DET4_9AGAR|nr:BTB domain-containing protein [Mycena sanguinolenta]